MVIPEKINVLTCHNLLYLAVIYSRSAKSYIQRALVLIPINNSLYGQVLSDVNNNGSKTICKRDT